MLILAFAMCSKLVLSQGQQPILARPRLQLIACAASLHSDSNSSLCFQYYSGSQVSWYAAHATCYSQGLALASIPRDLGAQIYSSNWMEANRVWERPGEDFISRRRIAVTSDVWFVNAHRDWYGTTREFALENGTRIRSLNGFTIKRNYYALADDEACVILNNYTRKFDFKKCSDKTISKVFFVCVSRSVVKVTFKK